MSRCVQQPIGFLQAGAEPLWLPTRLLPPHLPPPCPPTPCSSTTGVLFDDLTNAGARPRQGAAAAAGAMLGLPGLPERRRGDDPDRDSIVDLINTMPE